jgi:hypothetical protein
MKIVNHNGGDLHRGLHADLKALLDGELPPPRVWLVRAHLLVCAACREEVRWLKRLGEDMRDLERAVPSPRLRARILAALPDSPPGRPALQRTQEHRRYAIGATGFAGACAALAILAIITNSNVPASHTASPALPVAHGVLRGGSAAPGGDVALLPTAPAAVDPYSAEADRRLAQWFRDDEHRETIRLAANRASWTHLVAAVRTPQSVGSASAPVTLALAVPNVQDAQDRLSAWAASVGGSTQAPPRAYTSGSPVAPTVDPRAESSAPPAGSAESPGSRIVAIRLPATRLSSLQAVLGQTGAWGVGGVTSSAASRSVAGNGRTKTASAAGPSRVAPTLAGVGPAAGVVMRESVKGRQVSAPYPLAGRIGAGGAAQEAVAGQSLGRDGGAQMISLQIQLTSLDSPLP